jgi:hypothetical protein
MALTDRRNRGRIRKIMPLTGEAEALLSLHRDVNRMLDSFIHSFGFGSSFGSPPNFGCSPAWPEAEAQGDRKHVPIRDPEASSRRKRDA